MKDLRGWMDGWMKLGLGLFVGTVLQKNLHAKLSLVNIWIDSREGGCQKYYRISIVIIVSIIVSHCTGTVLPREAHCLCLPWPQKIYSIYTV